jgi:hypothetical protein
MLEQKIKEAEIRRSFYALLVQTLYFLRLKGMFTLLFLYITTTCLHAQDDLMSLLESEDSLETRYTEATFKGSRLIIGHSVKTRSKGQLDFLISHRFGRLNTGAHNLFGLDNAQIRLGLEYGLTDRLNIGIGRSSFEKTYDGFLKYKLLRQATGENAFPFTAVALGSFSIKTVPRESEDPGIEFNDRLATSMLLLLARKINADLSIQIMPAWVHRNKVNFNQENDIYALGIGGRYKLTGSIALNIEYYYRLNAPDNPYYNSFSVGFDLETGGHVFQLHFTNSVMTLEKSLITETFDDFWDGDIHFGFNISRIFQLNDKKSW